ncbi:unnamed protein product [Nezara viridula]|uniref:Uncharacterized protein n=1 Tax=Nezara viridula TaxID=85310 RepID=A0A9P0E6D6_NEZVI|nr:unnamed protein product [Nezara viridula]
MRTNVDGPYKANTAYQQVARRSTPPGGPAATVARAILKTGPSDPPILGTWGRFPVCQLLANGVVDLKMWRTYNVDCGLFLPLHPTAWHAPRCAHAGDVTRPLPPPLDRCSASLR